MSPPKQLEICASALLCGLDVNVTTPLRAIAGISEDAWTVTQRTFGPEIAAAVIALIYDKHATGEVLSPGGYLRGMVEKARAGDLHLERSFYGRLSGQAA
nr:replication initiation protein RepC [Ruegeria atlantica]